MTTGFFAKMFGKKVDLEAIRAEIRRIEQELGKKFDAAAFQNGDWFLENFHSFVERYRNNYERIREFEVANPSLSEAALADLLTEDAVRTATVAGGATGAAVSAAELTGLLTWGLSLTMGAVSALAEMIYLVNLQLRLTFDIAELNGITISVEEPEEMLVIFCSAFGISSLDLRLEGDPTQMARLAKAAGKYHVIKWAAKKLGYEIVRRTAAKYALPVLNIGLGAYLSRHITGKVGSVAKARFGKLRLMKERLFELRSKVGDRQTEVLLAALGFFQSDGLLTLEEIYLMRELARSLQASNVWQQILAGEIALDSAEFISRFRDPEFFDQRELLLGTLQIVNDAKVEPNEKETEFLRKLLVF